MRYGLALVAALLINVALLWAMQWLLRWQPPLFESTKISSQVIVTHLAQVPPAPPSPPTKPDTPQPQTAPPAPPAPATAQLPPLPPLPPAPSIATPQMNIPMPTWKLPTPTFAHKPYLGEMTQLPQPSASLPHLSPAPPISKAPNATALPVIIEADHDLQPLTRTPPIYPRNAKRLHKQGKVIVELVIGLEGQVEQATVIEAEPQGFFEQASLQAVRSWQFAPKQVNGQAVKQRARQTLLFKLR